MAVTKRIDGDYTIEPIAVQPSADKMTVLYSEVLFTSPAVVFDSSLVTITGDMTVNGTANFINRSDVIISDTIITLNAGEIAVGVAAPYYSGIEIDRGTEPDSMLLWRENLPTPWFIINDGVNPDRIILTSSASSGDPDFGLPLWNVLEDSTPQLGGPLDVNGKIITSTSNRNITFTANGTGDVVFTSPLTLANAAPGVVPDVGEVKIYSDIDSGGGTQIHFHNNTNTGELVSKSKAIVYSLIF